MLNRETLRTQPALLMTAEALLALLAVLAAAAIRLEPQELSRVLADGLLTRAGVFAGITVACLYYGDFYDPYAVISKWEDLASKLLSALAMTTVLLASLTFLVPGFTYGHGVLPIGVVFTIGAVLAWRLGFLVLTRAGEFQENVLIIGTGAVALAIAAELRKRPNLRLKLRGFLAEDASRADALVSPGVLGTVADLRRIAEQDRINRIVVALSEQRGRLPIESLLRFKVRGTPVHDGASFYEAVTGKILVSDLRPSWLVFSDGFRPSPSTRVAKRLVDLVLAAVGLVLAAPLMAAIAALVRLDSPGPALFTQARVGEEEREFTLYKFRSMQIDAEAGSGPVWASENDARITRVGRVMRKLRLDELPQLLNVLQGDMSFVGPRPERRHFVDQLSEVIPFYAQRHAIKPGVTGWAQVRYAYGNTVEDAVEKLQYDLYYIKHMSLAFDLAVVLQTVKVVLLGRGAM